MLRLAVPYIGACRRTALGQALCALEMHLSPPQEIAIVGTPDDPPRDAAAGGGRARRLPSQRRLRLRRRAIAATTCRCSRARALVDGLPAVYICERFACRAPLTDPAAVAEALA